MRLKSVLCGLLLLTFVTTARAADILNVADVEKIGGMSGVQMVPKDPAKGAGGELNFATAANKLVLMVMIQPTSTFDFWKKQYGASGEPIANLGAEAFRTKPGASISYVVFRKGDKGVWIQSMGWKAGGAQNFSAAQLMALAKIAAERL